ncbi:MAG TPA: hypothetical protein VGL77_05565 [Armatimonadota bacterium]
MNQFGKAPIDPLRVAAWLQRGVVLLALLGLLVLFARSTRHPQPALPPTAPLQVDAWLIGYRESGRIPSGLQETRGMATGPRGRLYIAGDRAVVCVDARERLLVGRFAVDGAPQCLAVGADGTLYVGFRDHVGVYAADGRRRANWPTVGGQAYITSLAATKTKIFVANAGEKVVLGYNLFGKVVARFGARDDAKGVPGLIVPSPHLDVVVDRDGVLWIANPGRHAVEAYAPDGALLRHWGVASFALEGFSGCCSPSDIAVLPDGRFVTSEKGRMLVKVYRPDGALACVVALPATFRAQNTGLDLATDAAGRIYVLDPLTNTVVIFTRKAK